jgi:hypothetical protein
VSDFDLGFFPSRCLDYARPIMIVCNVALIVANSCKQYYSTASESASASALFLPASNASKPAMSNCNKKTQYGVAVVSAGIAGLILPHSRLQMSCGNAVIAGTLPLLLINSFAIGKRCHGYFQDRSGALFLTGVNMFANIMSTVAIEYDATGHLGLQQLYLALSSGVVGSTSLLFIMEMGAKLFPEKTNHEPGCKLQQQIAPFFYYGLAMLARGIIIMGSLSTEPGVLVAQACMFLFPLLVLDRSLGVSNEVDCTLQLCGNAVLHTVLLLLLKPDEDPRLRIYTDILLAAGMAVSQAGLFKRLQPQELPCFRHVGSQSSSPAMG